MPWKSQPAFNIWLAAKCCLYGFHSIPKLQSVQWRSPTKPEIIAIPVSKDIFLIVIVYLLYFYFTNIYQ